jgi:predicted DNA-binding protein (MmcQ/YjbR family)
MNIDELIIICKKLPSVTLGIKWENDLCFMIGEKMFCIIILEPSLKISFKVKDEEFDEMSNLKGIIPAPYSARHKWILVEDINVLSKIKWEYYIIQSYNLVKSKLSKKKLSSLK